MLVDTRAGINILKRRITKETVNTEPKEFFMGNERHATDKHMTSQITDKIHIFHVVSDNFPLIEDGIIGLHFLKKYIYNITYEFLQLDNERILFQKLEETISSGEIIQSTK